MSRVPVCGIQSSVLRWARESIDLSIEEVARLLKCSQERIVAWECGEDAPTYSELEKLAYTLYKRPLAVFFLPQAPQEKSVKKEFRTLPASAMEKLAPDTILHIRRAKAFQLELESLYQGRQASMSQLGQNIALAVSKPVVEQAIALRKALGINLATQTSWRSDDQALKEWRRAIEAMGCFVFKSAFKQKEISGFCLPHTLHPLIYLNNSTSKTRQIFSLFHELAHILLNVQGLSSLNEEVLADLSPEMSQIEGFCNAIAAEVLVPLEDLQEQCIAYQGTVDRVEEPRVADLAKRYSVSREAVYRRLLQLGLVSQSEYEEKAQAWSAQKKETSGGDWFASQNSYLSPAFAQEVASRHFQNLISIEEAASMLGIHPKNYEELEHRISRGATA